MAKQTQAQRLAALKARKAALPNGDAVDVCFFFGAQVVGWLEATTERGDQTIKVSSLVGLLEGVVAEEERRAVRLAAGNEALTR